MKQNNYRSLIYFISATIAATIALQLYWNIQNYKVNKQRLINEVQISLDNGIESYFAELAKTDIFAFINSPADSLGGAKQGLAFLDHRHRDSLFLELESDSMKIKTSIKGFTQILDSGRGYTHMKNGESSPISVFKGKKTVDSLNRLRGLTNKIIVSITRDTIDFKKLDTILVEELNRKNIAIGYKIKHSKNDSIIGAFGASDTNALALSTFSKSTYLPQNEKLELLFTNPTLAVLKRSLTGIVLSLLLSASIIACLLYLLRVINKQKQLAEIKNDLISNITHEFKTPIATVATAIEGIKNFNDSNSEEKTNTYLDISRNQLQKLHLMVEKLLETATLDSDQLFLQKESTDLVFMLKKIVEKFQMLPSDKTISLKHNIAALTKEIDPFHFENAITNLIDNAIKYGGDKVEVNLNSMLNDVEITVADNGVSMDKNQRDRIFDKFYRIPTGNRHDVKGFGIGLFYSKKIIEKHGGNIRLIPNSKNTIFRITL